MVASSGRRWARIAIPALVLLTACSTVSGYHQIINDEPDSHIASLPLWHPAKRNGRGAKDEPETMPDGYGTWETCDRCERCIVGPPPAVRQTLIIELPQSDCLRLAILASLLFSPAALYTRSRVLRLRRLSVIFHDSCSSLSAMCSHRIPCGCPCREALSRKSSQTREGASVDDLRPVSTVLPELV